MQNNLNKENCNYEYAGFWVRVFAYIIDSVIVFFALLFIKLIMILPTAILGNALDYHILFNFSFKDIIYYLLGISYFVYCTYKTGATLGKKAMKIKVIGIENEELTLLNVIYRETIGRYLCKIPLGAGYIAVGVNSQKQGFHDMLCDTRVIYTNRTNDLNKDNKMIRTINTDEVTKNIKEMCIEANHVLSKDMDMALKNALVQEKSPIGCKILDQLQENMEIASKDMIPICQDTGMAVVFAEVGQDVHFEGHPFEYAVNEGIRQGYVEGFLRKSVVGDPLIRKNTEDNTPGVLHTKIVPGNQVKLTVAPKGFGSENMSRVFMLKPAEGIEGVKEAVLTAVKDAGPNACPPMVVGVGIGGTFEKCALMAKEALTREVGVHSRIDYVKDLEEELLNKINDLGIGPAGLGGTTTALAVNINTYPTHIAGLPVAINICCHVNRHATRVL